jgi:hypothetical protein
VFDIGVYLRAKTRIPGLTKYQQALIRPTLSTIISIPIFEQVHAAPDDPAVGKSLIGILNFDSDTATVAQFEAAQDAAHKAANMWCNLAGSVEPLMERILMNAVLEWIAAETPHAKVLRDDVTASLEVHDDADVRAAIERIEAFQARVTREALELPLVVVESA